MKLLEFSTFDMHQVWMQPKVFKLFAFAVAPARENELFIAVDNLVERSPDPLWRSRYTPPCL